MQHAHPAPRRQARAGTPRPCAPSQPPRGPAATRARGAQLPGGRVARPGRGGRAARVGHHDRPAAGAGGAGRRDGGRPGGLPLGRLAAGDVPPDAPNVPRRRPPGLPWHSRCLAARRAAPALLPGGAAARERPRAHAALARAQALAAHLAAWAGLVGGRFGLVSVDVPALPAGCVFPQAVLSPLLDAWRTARGQALVQPAELLAAAAAAGLLPRPGTGMRFSRCARWVACRRATVAASVLASARQLRVMARAAPPWGRCDGLPHSARAPGQGAERAHVDAPHQGAADRARGRAERHISAAAPSGR